VPLEDGDVVPVTVVWPWSELPNEDTTRSRLGSPVMRLAAPTQSTLFWPVAIGVCLMNPPLPLFRKMVRFPDESSELLTTARSGFPSPLKSPTATNETYWAFPEVPTL
jgi:hypothetical protein